MKKAIGGIALIIGLITAPLSLGVSAATNFVISEIQTGSKSSASEEYIQIHNNSSNNIDVTGWRIEYFSANPKSFTTPSRTIKLSGVVLAGGDYMLASAGYMQDSAKQSFSTTLATAGGHLRLVSGEIASPTVYDLVGWGTAAKPEGRATLAPSPGEAIIRNSSPDGKYIDTDNNESDFSGSILEVSSIETTDAQNIVITEVLPNPASPVADSVGEFIELYNPNEYPIALKGYKLLSGNSLNHSYIFKDEVIDPGTYHAFYSADTHVALTNSGGKVQLQSITGEVMSETAEYLSAPEGQAWAWDGGAWVWTTQPSPNAQNVLHLPDSTQNKKSATTKKASIKKPKVTSTKVKGASTSKAAKASSEVDPEPAPMHSAVLVGVGGLAVLYGIYEYRTDIANTFRKFRTNRRSRP